MGDRPQGQDDVMGLWGMTASMLCGKEQEDVGEPVIYGMIYGMIYGKIYGNRWKIATQTRSMLLACVAWEPV